jgi:hypothetical protein
MITKTNRKEKWLVVATRLCFGLSLMRSPRREVQQGISCDAMPRLSRTLTSGWYHPRSGERGHPRKRNEHQLVW